MSSSSRVLEAYRWQPGQSGNPGGRPATAPIAAAYRKFLAMQYGEFRRLDTDALTVAEVVARKQILEAVTKGKTLAAIEVTDRSEGPVRKDLKVELEFGASVEDVNALLEKLGSDRRIELTAPEEAK